MAKSDPQITLRSVELHILLSVVDRPRHGYAILQEAEERTDGRPGFEIPTLYRALRRLRDADLIRTARRPSPILTNGGNTGRRRVSAGGRSRRSWREWNGVAVGRARIKQATAGGRK